MSYQQKVEYSIWGTQGGGHELLVQVCTHLLMYHIYTLVGIY